MDRLIGDIILFTGAVLSLIASGLYIVRTIGKQPIWRNGLASHLFITAATLGLLLLFNTSAVIDLFPQPVLDRVRIGVYSIAVVVLIFRIYYVEKLTRREDNE